MTIFNRRPRLYNRKKAWPISVIFRWSITTLLVRRIHSCNWPDQLAGYVDCDPSRILGFKCPGADELTELESRFAPFPRFAIKGLDAHYILCVNGSPRLSSCGPGTNFSPSTLTCVDRFWDLFNFIYIYQKKLVHNVQRPIIVSLSRNDELWRRATHAHTSLYNLYICIFSALN